MFEENRSFIAPGTVEAYALLIARILFAPLFFYSGIGKVFAFGLTASRLPGGESGFGMVLAAGAVAVELGCALAVLLGLYVRPLALVFILYIIAATLMFHQFWASPAAQVVPQTLNFLKNLGLIGGFGLLAAFGAGPYSIRKFAAR